MNRFHSRRLVASIVLAFSSFAAMAAPVEVAGVKFEEKIDVAGSTLRLNGAGIRYKAIFKVYAAGLYLTRKASTVEEAIAAPGPKRLTVTLLREINSTQLGRLFVRGVEDSTPKDKMAPLVPGLVRMGQVFSDYTVLGPGVVLIMDWVPNVGTVLTVRGEVQANPIKGQAFYEALMRMWLGPVPVDFKLKDSLLGVAD